jgi:hypothetical protein
VANLAALDVLDRPPPGVAGGALAREPALGRLSPVGAPIDESPSDAVGGPVRVDATTTTVPSGVGASGGGGDLGERLVERARRLLGRQPARTLPTVGMPPTHLPAAPVKPDAHAYAQSVVAYTQSVVTRSVRMWEFVT